MPSAQRKSLRVSAYTLSTWDEQHGRATIATRLCVVEPEELALPSRASSIPLVERLLLPERGSASGQAPSPGIPPADRRNLAPTFYLSPLQPKKS